MEVPPQLKKILGKLRAYPVAIGAGAVALLLLVAIVFRSTAIGALETELTLKESEWNRISGNQKRARNLEEHLAAIKEGKAQVASRLMDPEERALNYDYFYSLEDQSGVRLIRLNQGGVIDTKGSNIPGIEQFKEYQLVGYTISIEGEFEQMVDFLSRLSNGRYLTRISTFTISRAQRANAGTLSANLQLQILGKPSNE